ncbi:MAG: SDR family oxidoreductase [Acidimicrobiia bacterium]|nr:SDR family oxidoreductase [Acidimicrobiia bacterium]
MTDQPDLRGRTVFITGANTGIGLEAAVDLARMGARVLIGSRDPDRGRAARGQLRRRSGRSDADVVALDLADLASVQACAEEILERCDELHVFVANAGLVLSERSETVQGFETTFGVNHLGHFLLTNLLLDRLTSSAPARVVVTSSLAHRWAVGGLSFSDLDRRGSYRSSQVYAESKLANLLFARTLADRLVGTGVTVNACHPGSVRSQFGAGGDLSGVERAVLALGRPFLVPPSRGATPLVELASADAYGTVTGEYLSGGYLPLHLSRPSRAARDHEAGERLWDVSCEMLRSVGYWPPPAGS